MLKPTSLALPLMWFSTLARDDDFVVVRVVSLPVHRGFISLVATSASSEARSLMNSSKSLSKSAAGQKACSRIFGMESSFIRLR